MVDYFVRIAAWLSQGINCLVLLGSPDQTVSARCYVNRKKKGWGTAYRLINAVFFWQDDHCFESHLTDLEWAYELVENSY